jgi:hypothetical protein
MSETYSWKEMCGSLPKLSSSLPEHRRIIVIGDLHGDYDKTLKSLKLADVIEIIGNKPEWKEGVNQDTIVVQVGDQIDSCRGDFRNGEFCDKADTTEDDKAEDIKILNMFTNLHNQAIKYGGAVYSLLGNHEIMNTQDRLEYVSYSNLMEFKDFDYKKYDQIKPFYKKKEFKRSQEGGNDIDYAKNNRLKEFKPGNPLANFLGCTRQMILKIGSNLFVHAGISPVLREKYGKLRLEDFNEIFKLFLWDKLRNPNDYTDILGAKNGSPLWNRDFPKLTTDAPNTCNTYMESLKKWFQVGQIMVGHTPQINTGIKSNCHDKVWMVDYGSSKAFDKWKKKVNVQDNIQVLEILNDTIFNVLSNLPKI